MSRSIACSCRTAGISRRRENKKIKREILSSSLPASAETARPAAIPNRLGPPGDFPVSGPIRAALFLGPVSPEADTRPASAGHRQSFSRRAGSFPFHSRRPAPGARHRKGGLTEQRGRPVLPSADGNAFQSASLCRWFYPAKKSRRDTSRRDFSLLF